MKIAIDYRYVGNSGIGNYIENIVDELLNNHPEHEYLLIIRKGYVVDADVKTIETTIAPFSVNEFLLFPTKEINKCDAYFTPYINIPRGIKIPIYSTIHDTIFLDIPKLVSPIGRLIRRWYMYRAYKKSEKVFTVSEFSKGRIEHFFGSKQKLAVTFNSISSSLKEYVNKNSVLNKKGNYIIYVGNIKRHKGLIVLLKAYSAALKKGYNKDLYIVGNANNFRTSDKEINRYFKSIDRIKFTGYLPNNQMYEMISKADVLILPTFYEGFGLTPLEALYLGTEVIISDIDVLKEIYKDLPVTFFKTGDVENLTRTIISHQSQTINTNVVRNTIDNLYNRRNSANIILKEIIKM